MLVLSRTASDGDDGIYLALPDGTVVHVVVIQVGGGRVRLGFSAPRAVRITRGELFTPEQRADLDAQAKGGCDAR